jgi:hypothetical protein
MKYQSYEKEDFMEANILDSRPMLSQGQALRGNDTGGSGDDIGASGENLDSGFRRNDTKESGNDNTEGGKDLKSSRKKKVRKKKKTKKRVRTKSSESQVQETVAPAIVTVGNAPQSKEELHAYVKSHLGLDVPRVSMCSGHSAPMDYLWHAYSADFTDLTDALRAEESADCIVWAGRGGGKTRLAAIATLLDSVFKLTCNTRILAGSLEQSSLMYDYFCDYARSEDYHGLLDGKIRVGRCRFKNQSQVRMLAHSQRDVRGIHINKLRCDEAELFRDDVFKAAQFVTKSREGLRGAMEVFSTMHLPYGVMQRLIDGAAESKMKMFKWCVWEVIEKCRPDRDCKTCPLWKDCAGKAKNACGYLKIDDVIDQMRRSSRKAFEAEMLCMRPQMEGAVFGEFTTEEHIKPTAYDPDLPLYLAIDFGYSSPFVCLWVQVDHNEQVRVIDEYVQTETIMAKHIRAVIQRTPGGVGTIMRAYCDPAGLQHNTVTGTSNIGEMEAKEIGCTYRCSEINEGIEAIRAAIKDAGDQVHFVVDPRCRQLIEAMRCYHYPQNAAGKEKELPVKDGVYDHPIDALRYFFVNRMGPKVVKRRC